VAPLDKNKNVDCSARFTALDGMLRSKSKELNSLVFTKALGGKDAYRKVVYGLLSVANV
jgi:hypothetical protein